MAWATSSLPVPDSPRRRTVVAEPATWATCSYTDCIARLEPTRLRMSYRSVSSRRSFVFSSRRRFLSDSTRWCTRTAWPIIDATTPKNFASCS